MPEIRDLFAKDAVNITITGDLEDVEIFLGLRKERSTPRPNYGKLSQEIAQAELDQASRFEEDDNFNPFSTSQWDDLPESDQPYARKEAKIGRNEPCPCGSGKKYKRCCL